MNHDHRREVCSCGTLLGQCRCPFGAANEVCQPNGCSSCKEAISSLVKYHGEKNRKLIEKAIPTFYALQRAGSMDVYLEDFVGTYIRLNGRL